MFDSCWVLKRQIRRPDPIVLRESQDYVLCVETGVVICSRVKLTEKRTKMRGNGELLAAGESENTLEQTTDSTTYLHDPLDSR